MLGRRGQEKRSGIIAPEERLPWGGTVALGFQHVLAMFGATVMAPLIMGFDPNLAILFSGIWVENRVDFTRGVNLFVAAVTLIVGAADYTVHFGDFELGGIALGTFGAIILYEIFQHAPAGGAFEGTADAAGKMEP